MVPTICHVCGRQAYKLCKVCHGGYCPEHTGHDGICSECFSRRGVSAPME